MYHFFPRYGTLVHPLTLLTWTAPTGVSCFVPPVETVAVWSLQIAELVWQLSPTSIRSPTAVSLIGVCCVSQQWFCPWSFHHVRHCSHSGQLVHSPFLLSTHIQTGTLEDKYASDRAKDRRISLAFPIEYISMFTCASSSFALSPMSQQIRSPLKIWSGLDQLC